MMKTMALLVTAMLVGCDAEPPVASAPAAAPAPALDAAVLAGRGLGSSSLPALQLLATPHGREFLSQVVSCALPPGAAITAINREGMPFQFTGALGLAPGWADHAPTGAERQRVTECLHGRVVGTNAVAAAVRTRIRTRP